jgi:hypothetical protein
MLDYEVDSETVLSITLVMLSTFVRIEGGYWRLVLLQEASLFCVQEVLLVFEGVYAVQVYICTEGS